MPAGGENEVPETAEIEPSAPGDVRIRRALVSVSDKRGVVELASGLSELGVEIVSTGGTARELERAGVKVRPIEEFTGFPEMMDGRVKTLHPRLYAGLLARRDEDSHLQAAAEHGIEQVDLVCVSLYPFEQTIARVGVSEAEAIENIDIGGPTMIRAAAKNHEFAAVVVDPDDYGRLLSEMRASGGKLSLATRRRLAGRAFALTARYDAAIAAWFAREGGVGEGGGGAAAAVDGAAASLGAAVPTGEQEAVPAAEALPESIERTYEKVMDLRYGENPHQRGAYYADTSERAHLLAGVEQLHGKELSFNNLLDLSAALDLAFDFEEPCCAIVKHNNPCGCAVAATVVEAYGKAFACDPQSAFGGVIAINRSLDRECAEAISGQFVEVLAAPGFDAGALEVLQAKKNVRLLSLSEEAVAARRPGVAGALEAKPVRGGVLLQDRDAVTERREQMKTISAREPTEQEWADMEMAWRLCMRVRSNAIVIVSGGATIGIGAGQMSRVDAVRIAAEKAREFQPQKLPGSALASDAFFPFPDGPQVALEAGVTAIVQPGGSVKDGETIEAVDAAGAAMVATDTRHFRH